LRLEIHRANAESVLEQYPDQMAADKSAGPGDNDEFTTHANTPRNSTRRGLRPRGLPASAIHPDINGFARFNQPGRLLPGEQLCSKWSAQRCQRNQFAPNRRAAGVVGIEWELAMRAAGGHRCRLG